MATLRTDIDSLKQKVSSAETNTREHLAANDKRLNDMTSEVLAHDRILCRNNVVIRGLNLDVQSDKLLEEINHFIYLKFGFPSAVVEAMPLGSRKLILVKFLSWNVKQSVMRKKTVTFRDSRINMDNALNLKEREIMAKARAVARVESQRSQHVKIGHLRIYMNDACMIWSDSANDFVRRMISNRKSDDGSFEVDRGAPLGIYSSKKWSPAGQPSEPGPPDGQLNLSAPIRNLRQHTHDGEAYGRKDSLATVMSLIEIVFRNVQYFSKIINNAHDGSYNIGCFCKIWCLENRAPFLPSNLKSFSSV